MSIQNFLEDVLLVTLPEEPHLGNELETLNEIAGEGCRRDVIIDFSRVEVLTSESICALMILEKYLSGSGRQLILCNVSLEVRHIFKRTGLEAVFQFTDDEYAALQSVRRASCLYG